MVHPTYITFLAAQNSSPVQHQRKKNGHLSHIFNPLHVEGRSGTKSAEVLSRYNHYLLWNIQINIEQFSVNPLLYEENIFLGHEKYLSLSTTILSTILLRVI